MGANYAGLDDIGCANPEGEKPCSVVGFADTLDRIGTAGVVTMTYINGTVVDRVRCRVELVGARSIVEMPPGASHV